MNVNEYEYNEAAAKINAELRIRLVKPSWTPEIIEIDTENTNATHGLARGPIKNVVFEFISILSEYS